MPNAPISTTAAPPRSRTSNRSHGPPCVLGPSGPEVTCEECFELLDEYVDLELAGQDADRRLPGMREHLEGCPACHEDHESLRDLAWLESHSGQTA
jgi:hypothetical protein